jgi:tetratricopeptide (TPR) repeat protein
MGNIYRFKEEYEKAMDCYNKALELKPTFTYAWNGKGNAFIDMDKFREALDCYDKAL